MMRRQLALGIALLAVTLAGAATDALAQDTITLQKATKRGTKLVGKITDYSPTEVSIETSGATKKVPVNEIVRITLEGEPSALKQARAAVIAGQYEQASEALGEIQLPASASAVLQQEVNYFRAVVVANLALHGNGSVDDAIKQVVEFVKKDRNTFHTYEAAELLGQLAVTAGNNENAVRYYQQLSKAPWPDYVLRSDILIGGALQLQGKFDEAIERFDKALTASPSDAAIIRQQTFAQIGKAACQAEKGDVDAAISALEEIIASNDAGDVELFAKAYLALGTAHRKAGRTIDAILAYLHIDLLFYAQRDAHAEALYYLTTLWPQVDEPARGVEAKQLLTSRYAGTAWARKAN